jgi:hypothetical protein
LAKFSTGEPLGFRHGKIFEQISIELKLKEPRKNPHQEHPVRVFTQAAPCG